MTPLEAKRKLLLTIHRSDNMQFVPEAVAQYAQNAFIKMFFPWRHGVSFEKSMRYYFDNDLKEYIIITDGKIL